MLLSVALLLGHIDPSHFAGALAADDDSPGTTPVQQMTKAELEAEMTRLDPQRTAFIGPTVMAGVGGLVAIIGGAAFLYGLGITFIASMTSGAAMSVLPLIGYVFLGLGGVMLVAGGIVLAVGLAKLFPALARRREAMERRDDIQRQLDGMNPQGPENLTPPPPPPPGDVRLGAPPPTLVLATF
jgi:hypothetical protein